MVHGRILTNVVSGATCSSQMKAINVETGDRIAYAADCNCSISDWFAPHGKDILDQFFIVDYRYDTKVDENRSTSIRTLVSLLWASAPASPARFNPATDFLVISKFA